MGKKLGITGQGLLYLEDGLSNFSAEQVHILCTEFGVSEDWLLYGNGSMFQEGHEVAKVLSRAELLELSKAKKQEIPRKAKMEREMVYSKRREYLINLRKNWGLSQEKFGKLIGKSYCQISFYECGRNSISDLLWNRIVELDGKQ